MRFVSWFTMALTACAGNCGVVVAESNPPPGAVNVLPGSGIEIQFQGPISIADARVRWLTWGIQPVDVPLESPLGSIHVHVPAAIEKLGRRRIRVIPLQRPTPGRVQEVRIDGLNGDQRVTMRFRTRLNPKVSVVNFLSGVAEACEVDGQNRVTVCWSGVAKPPEDGLVTPSDLRRVDSRVEFVYDGFLLQERNQFSVDAEGKEELTVVERYEYGYRETPVRIDGLDVLSASNPYGGTTTFFNLTPNGFVDTMWVTEAGLDDLPTMNSEGRVYRAFRYVRDETGRDELRLQIASPGPDQIWQTEDDPTGDVEVFAYDELSRLTFYELHNAGRDGVYGTRDDQLPSFESAEYVHGEDERRFAEIVGDAFALVYVRDEYGNPIRIETYGDPGPDGEWLTADDVSQTAYRSPLFVEDTYDADGQRILRDWWDHGSDTISFTDDDILMTREVYAP